MNVIFVPTVPPWGAQLVFVGLAAAEEPRAALPGSGVTSAASTAIPVIATPQRTELCPSAP